MRYHYATRAGGAANVGRCEGGVYRRAWGRARVIGSGGELASAAQEEGAGEGDGSGDGEEGEVVGEVVGDAFADLVEAEELVLDGAVVEVEAASAQEDAGEGDAGWVGGGAAAFDQLDEADDQDGGAEEVEEAVGDQAHGGGRAIVEVVPGEELVEDDLVEGAGEADADQDAWPEQGRAAVATVVGHSTTSSAGGSHTTRGRKPAPVSGGWRGG